MNDVLDALVVGAGAVGLATAQTLARKGWRVAVVERESRPGEHGSSRNSEVIHSGLYYPPGSLKARLCVTGRHLLYDWLRSHDIGLRRCGKLVVANGEEQVARLEALLARGRENGVEDLSLRGSDSLRRDEPWLRADTAIWSPVTGIFDSHGFLLSLQRKLEEAGGMLALRTDVREVDCADHDFRLRLHDDDGEQTIRCRHLVNAAGLGAIELARQCEGTGRENLPQAGFARGHYFRLHGASPTRHLVYPLPETAGLGVHLTLDMDGNARFGPDVQWIEQPDYRVDESRASGFYESIRQYWPGLPDDSLSPDYAGVRPKLLRKGEPLDDFLIQTDRDHGVAGLIHLLGIESPGLTASLAIAEEVARLLV